MEERNVILIGFMGAGKTSVGERLAADGKKPLIDTDQMIEARAGMTISRLFETRGEEAFRRMETQVLEELLQTARGDVISVGGGLPLREENRNILKKLGTVIYLQVRPETVLKRLEGDTTRPLLMGDDVEGRIRSLLAFREPIYAGAAHRVVPVDGRAVGEIVEEIKGIMKDVNGVETKEGEA